MLQRLYLLTPVLYGLFPIISLYSQNLDQVIPTDAFEPAVAVTLGVLVLMLVASRLIKDTRKMVFLVALFVVLFFLHGYFYISVKMLGIQNQWVVLAGWLLTYSGIAYFILRSKRDLAPLYKFVNVVGCMLVIFAMVPILYYQVQVTFFTPKVTRLDAIKPLEIKINPDAPQPAKEELPDIYYLVFDRYPSNRTLQKIYEYDNTPFTRFLAEKGFYVAHQSHANYFCTSQSMLSSLNMQHINDIEERFGNSLCDWNRIFGMMEDHAVGRFLKSQGYQYINVGNWWRPTRINRHAHRNIVLFPSEFSVRLYNTSALYPLGTFFHFVDFNRLRWQQNIRVIEELKKLPQEEGPKFVVAHVLLPHPPYFFSPEGNYLPPTVTENRTRVENFRNQLIYTNKRLAELIETILSQSQRPPIILLQADEGPYPDKFESNVGDSDPLAPWKEATNEEIREKTEILNAYYLPDGDNAYKALYPSITPVNSFRVVLNHYFHTTMEMLPDRIYAFPDVDGACKFFDVTDRATPQPESASQPL